MHVMYIYTHIYVYIYMIKDIFQSIVMILEKNIMLTNLDFICFFSHLSFSFFFHFNDFNLFS